MISIDDQFRVVAAVDGCRGFGVGRNSVRTEVDTAVSGSRAIEGQEDFAVFRTFSIQCTFKCGITADSDTAVERIDARSDGIKITISSGKDILSIETIGRTSGVSGSTVSAGGTVKGDTAGTGENAVKFDRTESNSAVDGQIIVASGKSGGVAVVDNASGVGNTAGAADGILEDPVAAAAHHAVEFSVAVNRNIAVDDVISIDNQFIVASAVDGLCGFSVSGNSEGTEVDTADSGSQSVEVDFPRSIFCSA